MVFTGGLGEWRWDCEVADESWEAMGWSLVSCDDDVCWCGKASVGWRNSEMYSFIRGTNDSKNFTRFEYSLGISPPKNRSTDARAISICANKVDAWSFGGAGRDDENKCKCWDRRINESFDCCSPSCFKSSIDEAILARMWIVIRWAIEPGNQSRRGTWKILWENIIIYVHV